MEESISASLSLGISGIDATERQESDWIRESQAGDAQSFNRLVLKWEGPIYNLALRMLQDREEATEAAQDIFLSAFRGIRGFRRKAKFSTWLYRIAVNYCISRLRRRPAGVHFSLDGRQPGRQLAADFPVRESHEGELLREESRLRVRKALERLSPEQRAIIELKFYQDLTFEEIAAVTRTPLSTVKSRLYAGLDILKTRLGQSSPDA